MLLWTAKWDVVKKRWNFSMTSEYILQSRVSHPDKIWEQRIFEVKQK